MSEHETSPKRPELLTDETFALAPAGLSRVCTPEEAISRNVRPGMTLHTLCTHNFAQALVYAIVRQFWGSSPGFTLATVSAREPGILMVCAGLVRHLVTSYFGNTYPTPGPNPAMLRRMERGEVTIEHWSLLSLVQRLHAAALGVPFLPTHSVSGSDMAENRHAYRTIEDPFGSSDQTGVVSALVPDLTLIHGLVGDPQGNVVLCPPLGEGLAAAMASREGVLATVERIVSPETIRKLAHLPVVPGHRVKVVCEVPLGAHPRGMASVDSEIVPGYGEDYDFMAGFREACGDEARLEQWIRRWVLDLDDFAAFRGALGSERKRLLERKMTPDYWHDALYETRPRIGTDPPTATETTVVNAARLIARRVHSTGLKILMTGIGTSNLAAWLAHHRLREAGTEIRLAAEFGMVGYLPRPTDPFIFNTATVPTCESTGGTTEILGVLVGGGQSQCIGVLGAGQIDRCGAINSTRIGDTWLVGSGGANDIVSSAREVIVVMAQSATRFVEQLSYCTAPGARVSHVVSQYGIYEKEGGELVLTAVPHPPDGSTVEEQCRAAKEACGWPLKVSDQVEALEPPSIEDVVLLRTYDPEGQFTRNPQRA